MALADGSNAVASAMGSAGAGCSVACTAVRTQATPRRWVGDVPASTMVSGEGRPTTRTIEPTTFFRETVAVVGDASPGKGAEASRAGAAAAATAGPHALSTAAAEAAARTVLPRLMIRSPPG